MAEYLPTFYRQGADKLYRVYDTPSGLASCEALHPHDTATHLIDPSEAASDFEKLELPDVLDTSGEQPVAVTVLLDSPRHNLTVAAIAINKPVSEAQQWPRSANTASHTTYELLLGAAILDVGSEYRILEPGKPEEVPPGTYYRTLTTGIGGIAILLASSRPRFDASAIVPEAGR